MKGIISLKPYKKPLIAALVLLLSIPGLFLLKPGIKAGRQIAAEGYVGAINGSFSVNNNGGSVYIIPIPVPPGTMNIQPQLAVSYNSKYGNGILGMGCSLEGLSEITRIPAAMAQDEFIGTVSYDSKDRFALDGQHLMSIHGAYGFDGTEYRTEIESWSKIISHGKAGSGPQYFTIQLKNGYILEYGNTDTSRIMDVNNQGARVWALNRITDSNGNYLIIDYKKDVKSGGYYPLRIEYTGNTSKNGTILMQPMRSVEFTYQSRNDTFSKYSGGSPVIENQLLSSITTKVQNKIISCFRFEYENGAATGRSRLTGIIQTAGDGRSLPKAEFVWQDGKGKLYDEAEKLTSLSSPSSGQTFPIDINGDGLIDLVHVWQDTGKRENRMTLDILISNGDGFEHAESQETDLYYYGNAIGLQPSDINGDGLIDLVYARQNENDKLAYTLLLSNGRNFDVKPDNNTNIDCYNQPYTIPMDIDGDGLCDLVYSFQSDDSKLVYRVLHSNGNGFDIGNPVITDLESYSAYPRLTPANINGDTMSDLVYAFGDESEKLSFTPLISTGKAFVKGKQVRTDFNDNIAHIMPMDINGDSLSDLACTWLDGSAEMGILFSNGKGFDKPSTSFKSPTLPDSESSLIPLDVNGDEMTDLMLSEKDSEGHIKYTPYLSNGFGFIRKESLNSTDIGWEQYSSLAADINGDGKTDILNIATSDESDSARITCIKANSTFPDLVAAIDNGIGARLNIQYKPITDQSVYSRETKDSNALDAAGVFNRIPGSVFPIGRGTDERNGVYGTAFPILDVQFPTYVVSGYSQEDGLNNTYKYSLHYSGAKIELGGRGWLGFRSKEYVDHSQNTHAITFYRQDFPYMGNVDYSTRSTASGNALMSKNMIIYESSSNASKVYQVFKTSEKTESYNFGKYSFTLGKDYKYDSYGNAVLIAESGDSLNKDTIIYTLSSYRNDTDNWILGLLTDQRTSSDKDGKQLLKHLALEYYPNSSRVISSKEWNDQNRNWNSNTFAYDAFGNLISKTDTSGNSEETAYDTLFNTFPVKKTTPKNVQGRKLVYSYEYDTGFGVELSETDPNGVILKKEIDGLGRIVKNIGPDPSGNPVVLSQDSWVLSGSGGYYIETSIRQDWEGKRWYKIQDYKDGIIRSYKTISFGSDKDEAIIVERILDSDGAILKESLPRFIKEKTACWNKYAYDEYGRNTSVIEPMGDSGSTVTKMEYTDSISTNIIRAHGTPESSITSVNYRFINSEPQVAAVRDGNGKKTEFSYDILSRINTAKDPLGITNALKYNSLDQKIQFNSKNTGELDFAYNYALKTYSQTDAKDNTIVSEIDSLGRIKKAAISTNEAIIYEYDDPSLANSLGRLSRVKMPDKSAFSYTYDYYGNISAATAVIDGSTYNYSMKYGPSGQLLEFRYPDGSILYYTYTDEGHLKSLDMDDATDRVKSSTVNYAAFSEYNAFGNPQTIRYGNKVETKYQYYSDGYLKSHKVTGTDGSILVFDRYIWDHTRQITEIEDMRDNKDKNYTQLFSYDKAGRLIGASGAYGSKSYLYDDSGNLLLKDGIKYTCNDYQATQGIKDNQVVFQADYDEVGNMKAKIAGGSKTEYEYDNMNRLTAVRKDNKEISAYSYDYDGNRIKQYDAVNGATTYYICAWYSVLKYDNGEVLRTKYIPGLTGNIATVTDASGIFTSQLYNNSNPSSRVSDINSLFFAAFFCALLLLFPAFSYFLSIGNKKRRLCSCLTAFLAVCMLISGCSQYETGIYSAGSTVNIPGYPEEGTLFFITNHIQSTCITTDSKGSLSSRITYTPYGDIFDQSGNDNFSAKFTGNDLDEASGLYYFGARYYDPDIGRFITADTDLASDMTEPGAFNRYAYAMGNPVRYIDPTGHGVVSWIASLLIDAAEIIAGIAINVLSGGSLSLLGDTLIGAGIGGLLYNVTNFDNFDWKGWGIQQGIGAVTGLALGGLGYLFKGAGGAALNAGRALESDAAAAGGQLERGLGSGLGRSAGRAGGLEATEEVGENVTARNGTVALERAGGDETVCAANQCFVKGTLIVAENGLIPIESIKIGDRVWSYNQETGTSELNRVTQLFRRQTDTLIDVYVSGQKIQTTPEHPFFVDKKGWVHAEELSSECRLKTLDNHSLGVERIEHTSELTMVYNFEVENNHTYYVSKQGILVHNVCVRYGARMAKQRTRMNVSEKEELRWHKREILTGRPSAGEHNMTRELRGWTAREFGGPGPWRLLYRQTSSGNFEIRGIYNYHNTGARGLRYWNTREYGHILP